MSVMRGGEPVALGGELLTWLADATAARERPCPICGLVPAQHDGWCECVGERELAAARLDLERWWKASAVGMPAWSWARFDNPDYLAHVSPKLLAALRGWRLDRGMVILGPSGAAKTSSIVARLCEVGSEARRALRAVSGPGKAIAIPPRFVWATASGLVQARRQHPLGANEAPEVVRAMRAPVLILDEVGFERGGEELLFDVADARYTSGRPTVVTSGLERAELFERYGSGAVRRLLSGAAVVDLHEEFV